MNAQRPPCAAPISWHTLSAAETCRRFELAPDEGLSSTEAAACLQRYGANRLAAAPKRPVWLRFLDQFRNVLIAVLIAAAVLAWLIGDAKDALVILVVVLLNASLGFWQEYRAERTLDALKDMLAPQARVRRDGVAMMVEAASLVPGDIVLLEAGDKVPADGRLLASHALEADESVLTGESHAVAKLGECVVENGAPLGDRKNLLYMNTVLTRGRAELIVTETGMDTEMGRLAGLIASSESGITPLQRQLDGLGNRLALLAGVVVLAILALDLLRGLPWVGAVLTAVALAVAAVPEGLPAVVTVTLAVGMWRMARNKAIVKNLAAVETLGATTVICSDKTGTLTLNQMTARVAWLGGGQYVVTGEGYASDGALKAIDATEQANVEGLRRALLPAVLCSDTRVKDGCLIGDPTEGALWILATKAGVDGAHELAASPRVGEIPFDSAHKYMVTFHRTDVCIEMMIKGAPDVVLTHATHWLNDGEVRPLDAAARESCETENARLASQGLRVLALARRSISTESYQQNPGELSVWVSDWTLLGLVGIADPPRPEARDAIALCHQAGIQVKMITGDHAVTAAAIAGELGLPGRAVSGAELDALDDSALAVQISSIGVFARVSPSHKVRIVTALKAAGHVVAMTGDGVNDAPALKAADIGVAMGINGTAVTREAAVMVLTDDNFATIVHAVKEGRMIYDNIVKFVRFQLSTNIGAILTVLLASLLGWPVPFLALHLLLINIVMDGPPAMMLGIEPARPGLMNEAPRPPAAQILTARRLVHLASYGFIMAAGTLLIFYHGMTQHEPRYATTLAFTSFVLFQVFNVFNARAERGSSLTAQFFTNGRLWLALAGVVATQLVVVHWGPAQQLFDTVDLTSSDWAYATLVASSVLFLEEARKLLVRLMDTGD